ncbi:MAG: hypothetical protein AAFR71_05450 [Pseudomonadota bacterium]
MTLNFLKKNRFTLAALTTIVIATAGISGAQARDWQRDGAARFEKMDADGDGQVTFAEFQTRMLEQFNKVDANEDSIVTTAEIEETADGRVGRRMIKNLVAMFDIDRDGEVSLEELTNRQQKLFAVADFDDSGSITQDELPRERFASMRGGFGKMRGKK